MRMYQVAIKGLKPSGGLYRKRVDALREIGFLQADDRRYAAECQEERGIEQTPWEYEVVEVEVTE
jgi:hypothetical protein